VGENLSAPGNVIMIVPRKELTLWERLYLPAIAGGLSVTWRHFKKTLFKGETAAKKVAGGFYPETPWVVREGYRGAPYLVKDQDGRTKCVSCQLCEFVCPPKAIRITPPGPAGSPEAGNVEKAPNEFEINMLRCIFCGYCQEVCPEEAIFLMEDYSLNGLTRREMIYNKEKLLDLGGVHNDRIQKWKNK
jgi:NADH-quinone oxidoreductase subunit I